MKELNDYILEQQLNEGLARNAFSIAIVRSLDPEDLLNGIISMYEYITDENDIKLFYQDMDMKYRPFWKNLYKMYEKKLWSIWNVKRDDESYNVGADEDDEEVEAGGVKMGRNQEIAGQLETNVFTDPSVELRRNLRRIIQSSSNSKCEIKPAEISKFILVDDPQFDEQYLITINRSTGLLRRLFKAADIKTLELVFQRLSEEAAEEAE